MNSIKSKIVFVTLALLFALGFVVVSAAVIAFYHDKELIIAGNDASLSSFAGQINTEISALEKNALDLALSGEVYYKQGKHKSVGEFITAKILQNYPNSMGNGIYFLPYKINKYKKIGCIHAVWKEGRIDLLSSCINSTFDYFTQNWYGEIQNGLKTNRVSWARPYKSTQLD
ncbi:MAG: hypothetical protein IKO06_01475, partial [Alphaproteobacteria bacterium]|nr:hypothetical protein [Alphaproteobacteria bacterium]